MDDIYLMQPADSSGSSCALGHGGVLGKPGPVGDAIGALNCEPTGLGSSLEVPIPSVASHMG